MSFQVKLFGISLDGTLDQVHGNSAQQFVDTLNEDMDNYVNQALQMTNELNIEITMTSLLNTFNYDSSTVKGIVVSNLNF